MLVDTEQCLPGCGHFLPLHSLLLSMAPSSSCLLLPATDHFLAACSFPPFLMFLTFFFVHVLRLSWSHPRLLASQSPLVAITARPHGPLSFPPHVVHCRSSLCPPTRVHYSSSRPSWSTTASPAALTARCPSRRPALPALPLSSPPDWSQKSSWIHSVITEGKHPPITH